VAASSGHLSANFSQWGKVVGLQRVTVLRLVLDEDRSVANGDDIRFLEEIMRRWDKEKPLCETDADWEVFKQELPEVYCRYAVNEVMPDVPDEVSHGVRL
jgi:hypothetical protein